MSSKRDLPCSLARNRCQFMTKFGTWKVERLSQEEVLSILREVPIGSLTSREIKVVLHILVLLVTMIRERLWKIRQRHVVSTGCSINVRMVPIQELAVLFCTTKRGPWWLILLLQANTQHSTLKTIWTVSITPSSSTLQLSSLLAIQKLS